MNRDREHFRIKLINEKERIKDTLSLMKRNQTIDSNAEISSELSFYDNHPSDIGDEITQIEKGRALKENELSIINKIDDALKSIDNGTYGICKKCGEEIAEDRLEVIPYALYCIKCQKDINDKKPFLRKDRPNEEKVMRKAFGYSTDRYEDNVGFDTEDSYQAVARYNNRRFTPDYYDDEDDEVYTDPIERISNQQYKNQLPD